MTTSDQETTRKRGDSRPGSMTRAMQAVQQAPSGPKVLRIGLIQGGKIVEERIIRTRETVSVGSSEKNHFVVPAVGSSRFELFQIVGNDYVLNFTDEMQGRVSLAGGVQELEALRKSGGSRKEGDRHQVKLTDSSRGKVVIADSTLLFQFVAPPPVQVRPHLPAAVVGGFVAGIDWLFTAFVMFSLMTHFGFIIYLENADWPVEAEIGTIPDRVAQLIFNEPEPPQPPPVETSEEEVEETETTEVAEAAVEQPTRSSSSSSGSSSSSNSASSGSGSSGANSDARLAAEQARAQVENLLLGALGGSGALNDVLRDGAATGRSQDLLEQATGVGVASSAEGGTLRERSGGGELGGGGGNQLGGLRAAGGDQVGRQQQEGERVVEVRVRGRTTVGALDDETGSGMFDSNIVVRQLRLRQSAIQRCYERELRNNPTLSGRVVSRFTIQPTGSVSGVQATENSTGSPAVADCVNNVVRGLRFNPGPEGGAVTYTFPFVFAVQN